MPVTNKIGLPQQRLITHLRLLEKLGPGETKSASDATRFLYSEMGLGIYASEFLNSLHKESLNHLAYFPNRDLEVIASAIAELNVFFKKNPHIIPAGVSYCELKRDILLEILELNMPRVSQGETQSRIGSAKKACYVVTPFAFLRNILGDTSVQCPEDFLQEFRAYDVGIRRSYDRGPDPRDLDPRDVLLWFFSHQVSQAISSAKWRHNPQPWEDIALGIQDTFVHGPIGTVRNVWN